MMNHLTHGVLSVETLLSSIEGPERGGTCVFLGTVRDDDNVTGIEYTAYDQMALAEIGKILSETEQRWPKSRVMIQHRLGFVPVAEASIAIAAAAPHRDEAFAACRYVIEEVKKRLPIWKKELHADGTATWVNPSGHPIAGVLRDR